MSNGEWEIGLNNLIARAERAEAAAREEMRYLEHLEKFIDVSQHLRELFRLYVTGQRRQNALANEPDPSGIAARFAPPPLPSEEVVGQIFAQMPDRMQ